MKRLAGWADAYSLLMAPHNVCGPVGTMANLHFAVATPELQSARAIQRLRRPVGPRNWSTVRRAWTPADGCFAAARSSGPRRSAESRRVRQTSRVPAAASVCSSGVGSSGRPVNDTIDARLALDAKAELGERPSGILARAAFTSWTSCEVASIGSCRTRLGADLTSISQSARWRSLKAMTWCSPCAMGLRASISIAGAYGWSPKSRPRCPINA